jgi:hypothetical protein
VFLIWFKEPFLMRGEWRVILLIQACMERVGVNVAVEAHAGFKEGVGAFDAIVDERGELLATLAIGDGEKVTGSVREVLQLMFKVTLPAQSRMDARSRLPVLFVTI